MDIVWFLIYWICCTFIIFLQAYRRKVEDPDIVTVIIVIFISPLLPVIWLYFLYEALREKIR
jgi:hypothetical protein